MSNNQLSELPRETGRLRQLIFPAWANRNQIVRTTETIGDLEQLEVPELWDNELEDVPDEISRLQNLKLLSSAASCPRRNNRHASTNWS